jgi:hypothetical protein
MAAVVLRFRASFVESVRSGVKTQTLRRQAGGLEVGDVVAACCRYDRGAFAWLLVESVDAVLVRELDELDVQREGSTSRAELVAALRVLYPRTDALVRVRFRVVRTAGDSAVSSRADSTSSGAPR